MHPQGITRAFVQEAPDDNCYRHRAGSSLALYRGSFNLGVQLPSVDSLPHYGERGDQVALTNIIASKASKCYN
jgi:hypothetical protein